MKIDICNHAILSPYMQVPYKYADKFAIEKTIRCKRPTLTRYEARLCKFKPIEDKIKVLSAIVPHLEEIVDKIMEV
jgi:hypothetical protein